MKKGIITLAFLMTVIISTAQTNNNSKQSFTGPDGKVSVTVYDNSNNLKVESVKDFYKYEVLDVKTSEPIVSNDNKGKDCLIDKSKLNSGNYNIRIYTKQFIITSKVSVMATDKIAKSFATESSLAFNKQD